MSNVVGSLGTPTALNLGLVVYELKQCVAHFSIVSESLRQNQQKLASVRDMTTDDLKHVSLGGDVGDFYVFLLTFR